MNRSIIAAVFAAATLTLTACVLPTPQTAPSSAPAPTSQAPVTPTEQPSQSPDAASPAAPVQSNGVTFASQAESEYFSQVVPYLESDTGGNFVVFAATDPEGAQTLADTTVLSGYVACTSTDRSSFVSEFMAGAGPDSLLTETTAGALWDSARGTLC